MFTTSLETDKVRQKDYSQDEGNRCAKVLARYILIAFSLPLI
jgi:hypothetical protein